MTPVRGLHHQGGGTGEQARPIVLGSIQRNRATSARPSAMPPRISGTSQFFQAEPAPGPLRRPAGGNVVEWGIGSLAFGSTTGSGAGQRYQEFHGLLTRPAGS